MMYKLRAVEVVRYPVLRLTFEDGLAGELDFSAHTATGPAFEPLKDAAFFRTARITDDGHAFGWRLDDVSHEIDFSADAARADIELAIVKRLAAEYRTHKTAAE
jgi:hypothetical protein